MAEPARDDILKRYVQIFKQLPRAAAAELVALMAEDPQITGSPEYFQAAALTVAGNHLFGEASRG